METETSAVFSSKQILKKEKCISDMYPSLHISLTH